MSDVNEYMTPPPPPTGEPTAEEKQWAMFAHFSALLGVLVGGWLSFLGPLIIWQIKKDTMPFVADQAKEALNFNITVSAVILMLWIVTFVTLFLASILTFPLMFVIGVGALIFVIIAGIKANEGVAYRYPFAVRLVK